MYVFGLTGGIASGKSTVSSILENHGFPIIDADVIARRVVEPGKPAHKLIVEHFGTDVLLPSGHLDRAKVGKIVFGDESKRKVLNRCTHPYIGRAMMWEIVKHFLKGEAAVFMVSPLLYESGAYVKWMKRIVVVNCREDQQMERLQQRDSLSLEAAQQRIQAQMPLSEKCQRADFVLDNSRDKEYLKNQALELCTELDKLTYKQKMLRPFLILLVSVGIAYFFLTALL